MLVGRRDLIMPLSKAAVAAGACGLLVEVNPHPAQAQSDGPQALTPEELAALAGAIGLSNRVAGSQVLAS